MPPKMNPNRFAPREKMDPKTAKRLFAYIFKDYKFSFLMVVLLIILSTVANVSSSVFLGTLIDDYITPLMGMEHPVFTALLKALGAMAIIYFVGILSTLFYNRIMVKISQGVLKNIRRDMFSHMQKLPIKYFDTHTHGDIMSHYTNDTDTLRQMISQSLPQAFSSIITIVSVLVTMFATNLYLTLFTLVFVVIMLRVTGAVAKNSGKFFGRQQQALGDVNGYIEEMINGQKVVKVFCHEDITKKEFDEKNNNLCENATNANKFA
ncbi:MAG: ABC transporter ATP-binding protein, partial [Clostridia bacterium]|nr:ABC transporter ATP-binding protein [Clostridia bacterium]